MQKNDQVLLNNIYFRPQDGKCPRCGTFAQHEQERTQYECEVCATQFNEYVIWQVGDTPEFENN